MVSRFEWQLWFAIGNALLTLLVWIADFPDWAEPYRPAIIVILLVVTIIAFGFAARNYSASQSVKHRSLTLQPSLLEEGIGGATAVGKVRLDRALRHQKFAVVNVTNSSGERVTLVADIFLDDERLEAGAWWSKAGKEFHAEPRRLEVGERATFIVATSWDAANGWYLVENQGEFTPAALSDFYSDLMKIQAAKDQLGKIINLRVRFQAQGIDQSVSLRLRFENDLPALD